MNVFKKENNEYWNMEIECQGLAGDLAWAMNDVSQEQKASIMDQLILDLMDYTEQSSDEELWCRLYEEFQRIYHEIDCR